MEFITRFSFKKGGRIVNLTSGQSLGPMPSEIAYAITKGAIETLTYTLSQEIAAKGITINAVNPGPNDTGWMDDQLKADLIKRFPMKRLGTPQDTANLIGFLASEEAEWITGQIIHSEGGFKR
jgi:3-oxoacyl-[acyl-carrier protein] reductase